MECDLPHDPAIKARKMICKVTCSILLLASAAMAQELLPGTLASSSSSSSSDERQPITGQQRIQWAVRRTISPGVLFSAGLGTLFDVPKAYGTHWEGFGERYGIRLSTLAVSNTMEAGLGAIWGEDPRYTRDAGAPFKNRIGHAIKMTYMAENHNGDLKPAYARFMALPGSNFLSNSWRADSDATLSHASIRTGLRFLGRLGNNTFDEFWPDVRQKLHFLGGGETRPVDTVWRKVPGS
jgi:hypothetical protein